MLRPLALRGPVTQSSGIILRLGTRGSPLALAQARMVRAALAAAHGLDAERDRDRGDPHHRRPHPGPAAGRGRRQGPVHQGDRGGAARRRDRSRGAFGEGHADGAAGRAGARRRSCSARMRATCSSAARRKPSRELPHGATVGTASLRRQAMVKRLRPDLAIVPLRGNVETRLRKLDDGEADATLLALAGLKRLGLADAATAMLDVDEFLPAVGQGAIGIETRADDARTRELLAAINHADTFSALAGRARLPRRARRLVPHADRRPCDDRGRTAAVSRHDREARRQRSVRGDARGRRAAMPKSSAPMPARELKGRAGPDFFSV